MPRKNKKSMQKVKDVPTVPVDLKGNTNYQINPCIRWCFTLHDYKNEDIEFLKSKSCSNCASFKYVIFSEELGESGTTKHLQGYFELTKKKRWNELSFKKEYHFEKAKGTKQQNIDYIMKEGGQVYINGIKVRKVKLISDLYQWEKDILHILDGEPDDRTINWFWETKGCHGKTQFCKFVCSKYNAIVVSGKASDIFNGIINWKEAKGYFPDIVIIDIPRSVDIEYLSYTAIEKVKDGLFFSGKYEAGMCIMPSPHILIFANEEPDLHKMSADRWNVKKLR